jgi:hypothetical protein
MATGGFDGQRPDSIADAKFDTREPKTEAQMIKARNMGWARLWEDESCAAIGSAAIARIVEVLVVVWLRTIAGHAFEIDHHRFPGILDWIACWRFGW